MRGYVDHFPPMCHTTWLASSLDATKPQTIAVQQHHTSHTLNYVRRTGPHGTRWAHLCKGRERFFRGQTGMLRFQEADNEVRTYVGTVSEGDRFDTLLIPPETLRVVADEEGLVLRREDLHSFVVAHDLLLQRHVERFVSCCRHDEQAAGRHDDRGEAIARELTLRLCEISSGMRPDWHADQSCFDSATFRELLDVIDSQLATPPSQATLARRVALSPSHFARKFRNTTGQSLHRFINTRRVHAAMRHLIATNISAARLAFDLGFSSQSHFIRIFKTTTGITPDRYRRPFSKSRELDAQNMPNAPGVQEATEHAT
jgi:AraC-like DNA-binding protein